MSTDHDNRKEALLGSSRDFRDPAGSNALSRTESYFAWQQNRSSTGYWPYSRSLLQAPRSNTSIVDERGRRCTGINYASQDYLSLSGDPEVIEAAITAIREFGVHSAGSAVVVGNTPLSLVLEAALGEFLDAEHVTLYPTGWAAGYGVTRALIRASDYVLLDGLSHACLQEGAFAATRNVSFYRHLDLAHARGLLARIRAHDAKNAVLVITESLFSMDSDVPDLEAFQMLCSEYDATLLVDVAHDLGALGPDGLGALGTQKMHGKVDLVMGSFSKTLASNGGFVAARLASVKQFLKAFSPSHTFSNALAPPQAATILAALRIVRSPRGADLRDALMRNIELLRNSLKAKDAHILGTESPIVPVLIGREDHARIVANELPQHGLIANLAEYPGVPQGSARLRLQVMASHEKTHAEAAAEIVSQALETARAERP